ncbi:MAG: hypothetical protein ACO3VG_03050, partial [Nitriliruptoraceae bacterium]
SARIARAKAKAAWGRKEKARLADVHVESSGEIDQETYDRLIAEGKGERIARAKAKAAWVRQQKQRMLEEGGA